MSRVERFSTATLLEQWWASLREEAERNEYPEELMRRLEDVGHQIADYHLLETENRKRLAAMARAIRAFVRRSGAALPRAQSIEKFASQGPYAIELSAFDAGPCIACGAEVGAGPVGRAREPEPGPLCDRCFEERCPTLGHLLTRVHSLREVGELECRTAEEKMLLISMLITLGRLMRVSPLREWPIGRIDPLMTILALGRLSQPGEVE